MTKIIELKDRRQFRILLNPVRQDILHLLRRAARPMTASAVAERMLLSPSAAQAHLQRLVELGAVEQVAVSGRPSALYRIADAEIRLDLGRKDGFQGEREALAAQMMDGTFRGILHAAYSHGEKELEDCRQFQFGALHLKPEERAELQKIVEDYLRAHGAPQAEAEHWEYVLMAYRADDVKP